MLAENKFTKYLLYAVGEIVLVVIGILIALSINNWSEEAKRNEKEIALLNEMHENLKLDSTSIALNIRRSEMSLNASNTVLEQLEARAPWLDSMETHYARLNFGTLSRPVRSAYENFKSIGFDLITNDSLRSQINSLYEKQYPFIQGIEQEFQLPIRTTVVTPQLQKKVRTIKARDRAKPVNLELLFDDHEFQEAIRRNVEGHEMAIWAYEMTLEMNDRLVESIERELESRQ